MKRFLILLMAAVAGVAPTVQAVPQQINYQGQLTSGSGAPLDTTVAMTFKLYSDTTQPATWTETHSSVIVQRGLFNVGLGQITSLPESVLNFPQVWLGISVGSDAEMVPHVRIVSVAYARRVGTVDGATGGTITSDLFISGQANIGIGNTNGGNDAFVAGRNDSAGGNQSCITGGLGNSASGLRSFVGGGESNSAGASHAFVGGGFSNNAHLGYATIAGGYNNSAQDSAFVGGGRGNSAGSFSVVGGGYNDAASGQYCTVGGGGDNTASNFESTIGGGDGNQASGIVSTVGGGFDNTASLEGATVGGGQFNTASAANAVVSGGDFNTAGGLFSTVPGGQNCIANGDYSFVAGRNVKTNINASGTFVWGDNDAADTLVAGLANRVVFRAYNGYRLYTTDDLIFGVLLNHGDGAWSTVSDSTKKENVRRVNTADVLAKLSKLPISEWNYRSQDAKNRHMGPMAQDFWNAFHLGDSDTTISTLDPDGVALAAIQELAKENQKLETQNQKEEEEIQELRAEVQNLSAGRQWSEHQSSMHK